MKIAFLILVANLSLSGCATFTDLQRTSADELLPRPTAQVQHADYGVADGFVCDGLQKTWAKTTPSDVQLFERARYCAIIEDDDTLVDSKNTGKTSLPRKHLARFVRNGMELADAHCEVFLDAVEGKRVLTEFNLSTFNALVGAATAAMSKLANHPQSLFNLAIGAAGVNSFADNYKANFLLTGAMHQLRAAVKNYRTAMVDGSDLAAPELYTSFAAAQGDLREYAGVCSHKGLVHIVNTKLADTKFEAGNKDKSDGERLARMLLEKAKRTDPQIVKAAFAAGEFETVYEIARLDKSARLALMVKLVAAENKLLKEKFPGVWQVVLALALDKDTPENIDDILRAGQLLSYTLGGSQTQAAQIAELVNPPAPGTPKVAITTTVPVASSAFRSLSRVRQPASDASITVEKKNNLR